VELNHIAFEVGSLDDVVRARDHLRRHGDPIDLRPPPRWVPARGRIPRPRQPPARDLLGHRPDRQRRLCQAAGRMEGGAQSRRRRR
jgi:hypothetical protein